jgi:hypothetical protein
MGQPEVFRDMAVIFQFQRPAGTFKIFKHPFFLGLANAFFYDFGESCKHLSISDLG